jgi:hypothetical protein
MTKSFDEVLQSNRAPDSEWEVIIDGNNFSDRLELLEFEHKINNSMKFTIRLSGIDKAVTIPVDSEVLIKYNDGLILRGVLREFNPTSFNQYEFEGSGYAAELEADSETVFENEGVNNPIKDTDVKTVVNTLVNNSTVPNNRTFSTEFEGTVGSIPVDDFRAEKRQMSDINKLLGAYDAEWYVTTQQTVDPVLQITDQVFFSDAADDSPGNPKDVFRTFGKDQNVDKVDQNVNRNLGDFDSVIVRGFGDGDDQIQAKSGNSQFGKGERTLVYTDKSIISEDQAQKKADNLKETQSVDWREIEVKLSNPNQIFGIGDEIKVDSPKAKVSGNFRIVEVFYKIRPEFNVFEARINLSNKPQTFTDDFLRLDEKATGETDFGQGSRNTISESNQDLAGSDNQNDQKVALDFNIPVEFTEGIQGKDNTAQVLLNFAVKNFKKTFNASSSTLPDTGTVEGVNSVTFGDVETVNTKGFDRPDGDDLNSTAADVIQTDTNTSGGGSNKTSSGFKSTGETGGSAFFNTVDTVTEGTDDDNAGIFFHIMAQRPTSSASFVQFRVEDSNGTYYPVEQGVRRNLQQTPNEAFLSASTSIDVPKNYSEVKLQWKLGNANASEQDWTVFISRMTRGEHTHTISRTDNGAENVQAFMLKSDGSGGSEEIGADQNANAGTQEFINGVDNETSINDLDADDIILSERTTSATQLTVKANGTEIDKSPFDLTQLSSSPPFKKSEIPISLDKLNTPGENRITLSTDNTALVKGNVTVDHKLPPERQ